MKDILSIACRECRRMWNRPIYLFCMVVFPLLVMIFFTTMMHTGQPQDMPVGVVDLDRTATTRALIRNLDAFQTSHVVAHYASVDEARHAMQRNEIYGFLYLPQGTTSGLMAQRRPTISFYYSNVSLTAGSLVYRDLKTVSTLGSAAAGQKVLLAKGLPSQQARTFLQPIVIDLHPVNNPWINYNVYLSSILVPGVLMLFILLLTAYSLSSELKEETSRELVLMARGNIYAAILGKLLPMVVIFFCMMLVEGFYLYGLLAFPHPGGWFTLAVMSILAVLACVGLGVFIFAVLPSMRMSMSVSSLLGMLGFSMAGSAFPVLAMDGALQLMANLFPLRHYFLVYQTSLFNGFPLSYSAWALVALAVFACLPLLVLWRIKNVYLSWSYEQ